MPDAPDRVPTGTLERAAVAFARVVRAGGVDVPVTATVQYAAALALVGFDHPERVYWAGRATLVTAPEQLPAYDRAFDAFWLRHTVAGAPPEPQADEPVVATGAGPDEAGGATGPQPDDGAVPTVAARWSPVEVLRRRDFASYSEVEHDEARRLIADLRLAGAPRPTRRRRPGRRGRPDLRRTVRRSLRTGGEPVRRAFTAPHVETRRLVLLLDVSGSMEPYARAFVRFLHAAVVARRRVEAFALGTRLHRITRELATRDPDAAISAAAAQVTDWSGGTRLGECLREFNDGWGVRGVARGAVVVICSDGWDRGDPALVAEQMQRLRRVARRVVWANPLKASPEYAPEARGMAAALPYVDDFVEGHSLAALEHLADVVSQ